MFLSKIALNSDSLLQGRQEVGQSTDFLLIISPPWIEDESEQQKRQDCFHRATYNDNLFVFSPQIHSKQDMRVRHHWYCPVNVQTGPDNQAVIVHTVVIASAGNCAFLAEILISIVDQ